MILCSFKNIKKIRQLRILFALLILTLPLLACDFMPAAAPAPAGPPTVSILRPATGITYQSEMNVLVVVEADDATGPGIARVALFVDNVQIAERIADAPLATFSTSFDWIASGTGAHAIHVIAYRADGTASTPASIALAVAEPTATPSPTPLPTATPEPTATPIPTETPEPTEPADDEEASAPADPEVGPLTGQTVTGANVRSGPGEGYDIIFVLPAETVFDVIGHEGTESWFQITHYPDPENRSWTRDGWIYSGNITVDGDTESLAVVSVTDAPAAAAAQPAEQPAAAQSETTTVDSTAPLVALGQPITTVGREVCQNPMMTGEQVTFAAWLNGVQPWWQEDYVGVQLPGAVTEGVRSQTRAVGNTTNIGHYLLPEFEERAVEMGGTWRTFWWSMGQSNIPVQAGKQYSVQAIFHPFVKVHDTATGGEPWATIDNASAFHTLMNWRWNVELSDGTHIVDNWNNISNLGMTTWELPHTNPIYYTFSFQVNRDDVAKVWVEFQNPWPIAVSKIWMHAAHCYEY